MCIRDREKQLTSLRAQLRGLEQENAALRGELLACDRHPVACLLYTSDAADERSSVDLGGRRIIKKNKYETTDAAR